MEPTQLDDDLFLVEVGGKDNRSKTLSFSRSPTVLLNFAANRFTRLASRDYQDNFGIGATDWRMLVMMTRLPGCSVAQASRTIGIDKGAVSRSLARLNKKGLARATCEKSDIRRKSWSLTVLGKDLHERVLVLALARQGKLLKGFSRSEVELLTTLLERFLDNLAELQNDQSNAALHNTQTKEQ